MKLGLRKFIKRVIDLYLNQHNGAENQRLSKDQTITDADYDAVFKKLRSLAEIHNGIEVYRSYKKPVKEAVKKILHLKKYHNDAIFALLERIHKDILKVFPGAKEDMIWEACDAALDETMSETRDQIPEVLNTENAKKIWRKCIEENYVNESLQPLVNKSKAAMLAYHIGVCLNIDEDHRWVYFARLWDMPGIGDKYSKVKNSKSNINFLKKLQRSIYY